MGQGISSPPPDNNIYISHSSVRFEEMTMDTSALVVAANLIGGGDGARIDLTVGGETSIKYQMNALFVLSFVSYVTPQNVDIQATSAVRRSYTLSDASIGRILGSKVRHHPRHLLFGLYNTQDIWWTVCYPMRSFIAFDGFGKPGFKFPYRSVYLESFVIFSVFFLIQ